MLKRIRDRLLLTEIHRDERNVKIAFLILGAVLLLLLGNLFYLNINLSSSKKNTTVEVKKTPESSLATSPTPTSTAVTNNPSDKSTIVSNRIKDYYINLGSGGNQSTDWTDVPGTLTTFDFGQYQDIKEAHLETTVNVPTANGTISVRLFNKTDGIVVWNSERTVQAQANGDLLVSQSLIYSVSAKLYQIQMKSQLNVPANLLQARIHITLN